MFNAYSFIDSTDQQAYERIRAHAEIADRLLAEGNPDADAVFRVLGFYRTACRSMYNAAIADMYAQAHNV